MSIINTMLTVQNCALMNQVNIMNMQNSIRIGAIGYIPKPLEEIEEPIRLYDREDFGIHYLYHQE